MIEVLTSDGKRWYFHATARDLNKALAARAYIGMSAYDEGAPAWQIAPEHVVAYRDMDADE